jgi:hypothetical protein
MRANKGETAIAVGQAVPRTSHDASKLDVQDRDARSLRNTHRRALGVPGAAIEDRPTGQTGQQKKKKRFHVEIRILGGVFNGGQCRCRRCSS